VWYFFAAVVLVGAIFFWDYRRKAARREVASKQRFDEMLKAGAFTPPPAPAPASKPAAASASAAVPVPAPVAAPGTADEPEAPAAIAYAARDRLLSQPERLAYLLLKTGLPDHEIFPRVPLTAVVDIPGAGYDHEQHMRRLSRQQLDFVVCDKAMKIVAAVQFAATGPEAVVAQRIRSECLKTAGIRLVTIQPAALPKRAEVRAFILGAQAAATAPLKPV
jgi:hypothetical protein